MSKTPATPRHAAKPDASREPRPTAARRRSATVLTYGGLLLVAVIAFASHEWGAGVHSVVGIAVVAIITWHVGSQHRWVRAAARRRSAHPDRALLVYNPVLAAVFLTVNLSGILMWFWGAGGFIAHVHQITGIAFLPLVLGHLVLNRRRLMTRLRDRRSSRTATT